MKKMRTDATDAALLAHSNYSPHDLEFFRRKGYVNSEILDFWDRDAARGLPPTGSPECSFVFDAQQAMEKLLAKSEIKIDDWRFELDNMSGTWAWNYSSKPSEDSRWNWRSDCFTVYATWGWENKPEIAIAISYEREHRDINYSDEPMPMCGSGDAARDVGRYLEIMSEVLPRLIAKHLGWDYFGIEESV